MGVVDDLGQLLLRGGDVDVEPGAEHPGVRVGDELGERLAVILDEHHRAVPLPLLRVEHELVVRDDQLVVRPDILLEGARVGDHQELLVGQQRRAQRVDDVLQREQLADRRPARWLLHRLGQLQAGPGRLVRGEGGDQPLRRAGGQRRGIQARIRRMPRPSPAAARAPRDRGAHQRDRRRAGRPPCAGRRSPAAAAG